MQMVKIARVADLAKRRFKTVTLLGKKVGIFKEPVLTLYTITTPELPIPAGTPPDGILFND